MNPGDEREIAKLRLTKRQNGEWFGEPVYYWEGGTGLLDIYIKDSTGEIVTYEDGREDENLPPHRRGRPFWTSESDVVARSEAKLDALGWHHGADHSVKTAIGDPGLPVVGADGNADKTNVYVMFNDRVGGYRCLGGNYCQVGLNSVTGNVARLQRFTGYRYGSAIANVTPDQALSIVRQTDTPKTIQGPEFMILSPLWTLSDGGRQLCQSRTCPLVYQVAVEPYGSVAISADTGELLSRNDSPLGAAVPPARPVSGHARPETAKPGAPPQPRAPRSGWLAWIGAAVAAAVATALVWVAMLRATSERKTAGRQTTTSRE